MRLIQLPHFAVCAPAEVTVPGVSQVEVSDLLEALRCVEARSHFIRERLIVNKAVDTGRADGTLVQAHCVRIAALNARDLGTDQRGAALEILATVRCQNLELLVVNGQCL
jgi:hypothetical protein